MTDIAMPIGKLTSQLTIRIRITGLRTWRVRCWVAVQVMKLAATIAGTNIVVEVAKPARERSDGQ